MIVNKSSCSSNEQQQINSLIHQTMARMDVLERRLKLVFTLIQNGNYKKALNEIDKQSKKSVGTPCTLLALRCVALHRSDRWADAWICSQQVMNDTDSLFEDIVVKCLTLYFCFNDRIEALIELRTRLCDQEPSDGDLLDSLIASTLRRGDFGAQRRAASRLFKLTRLRSYNYWSVFCLLFEREICILREGQVGNVDLLSGLANRMSENIDDPYLQVLVAASTSKYGKVLAILDDFHKRNAISPVLNRKRIETMLTNIYDGDFWRTLETNLSQISTSWSTFLTIANKGLVLDPLKFLATLRNKSLFANAITFDSVDPAIPGSVQTHVLGIESRCEASSNRKEKTECQVQSTTATDKEGVDKPGRIQDYRLCGDIHALGLIYTEAATNGPHVYKHVDMYIKRFGTFRTCRCDLSAALAKVRTCSGRFMGERMLQDALQTIDWTLVENHADVGTSAITLLAIASKLNGALWARRNSNPHVIQSTYCNCMSRMTIDDASSTCPETNTPFVLLSDLEWSDLLDPCNSKVVSVDVGSPTGPLKSDVDDLNNSVPVETMMKRLSVTSRHITRPPDVDSSRQLDERYVLNSTSNYSDYGRLVLSTADQMIEAKKQQQPGSSDKGDLSPADCIQLICADGFDARNLFGLICMLQDQLDRKPAHKHASLMLIRCFSIVGLYHGIDRLFNSLMVKNVQVFSLAHLVINDSIRFGAWDRALETMQSLVAFSIAARDETADFVATMLHREDRPPNSLGERRSTELAEDAVRILSDTCKWMHAAQRSFVGLALKINSMSLNFLLHGLVTFSEDAPELTAFLAQDYRDFTCLEQFCPFDHHLELQKHESLLESFELCRLRWSILAYMTNGKGEIHATKTTSRHARYCLHGPSASGLDTVLNLRLGELVELHANLSTVTLNKSVRSVHELFRKLDRLLQETSFRGDLRVLAVQLEALSLSCEFCTYCLAILKSRKTSVGNMKPLNTAWYQTLISLSAHLKTMSQASPANDCDKSSDNPYAVPTETGRKMMEQINRDYQATVKFLVTFVDKRLLKPLITM